MSDDVRPYLPELADAFGREPPALDATTIPFRDAETWGHRTLSNPNTIRPGSVPEALYAYEIGSDPALADLPWVVSKRVYFNFEGTLILAQPLDLGEEGCVRAAPEDIRPRSAKPVMLEGFAREVGIRTKPPKDRER